MKGKGLLLTSFLILALAVPSISFAKDKEIKKTRKPTIFEVIEEEKYREEFFSKLKCDFPLDTIEHYPITSDFGLRKNPVRKRTGGPKEKDHVGWDIGAYRSKVYSIAEGKVVMRGYTKKAGKFIQIECDEKYKDFFSGEEKKITYSLLHLHKISVKIGERVKKGKIIAISGNTGITKGAHLHFHLQIGEEYVDPKTIYPEYPYFEKNK